jgi:putative transposase
LQKSLRIRAPTRADGLRSYDLARVSRSSLPDGYFHVVTRGVWDRPIYLDDVDRRRFVDRLRRCETKYDWICHVYCLMTTHYHLVVETSRRELSRGLQWLNGRYAHAFNKRHARYGHVFGERYSVRVIDDEQYLYDACSYVLLNPVKAGLCDRSDEWPWSYNRFEAPTQSP